MGTVEDREGVRDAFRKLYLADRDKGTVKDLARYEALFPGFRDLLAEELPRLEATAAHGATITSAPPGSPVPGSSPTPAAASRPGPDLDQIGPYRVLAELGRGGMGVVYLAEDERLHRRVALKVLPPHFASSRHLQLRFQREATLASKLDHPNICTVYEAGEADGVSYMAMRLLEGKPLSEWVGIAKEKKRPSGVVTLPPLEDRSPEARSTSGEQARDLDRILALLEKAARALHVAHEKGLIHRDIKPHNIMVTAEGEPVLLDFGLAREEEGEGQGLTQTGSLMGTPAYMSPEQLVAQRIRLDRRTDVYSLGVCLYECLTLQLPFNAPTTDKLYQKILATDPEDPRRLNRLIPDDLRVVLETALEKDRDRRYQSSLELAEELRRVRVQEPIRARAVGPAGRLLRWSRRNPALSASLACTILALAGGLALSLTQWLRAQRFLGRAEQSGRSLGVALQRATEESVAKEEALRRARALGLVQASEIAAQQDQTLALLLAREAAGISREPDVMKRLRAAVHESRERAILGVEGAMIEQARISPRGDLVAAALSDGTVRLWTLAGEPRAILTGHSARVVDVSFSAGGDRLLSTSLDGTARLWGTDGQLRAILRDPAEELATARFADSGKCILTLSAGRTRGKPALGVVRVWDADGKEGRPLGDATSPQVWAAFLPGSEKVLTMDASGTLTLWFPGDLVGRTFYSPKDGNATGSRDQRVFCAPNGWHVLVDDSTGTTLLDHEGHRLHRIPAKSDRRECVFSPDGSRFAIWQTLNADDFFVEPLESQVRVSFNGHRDEVTDVAFSPDGSLLVSASSDHTAIVWRPDGTPRLVLRGHRAGIESVAFSPDGSTVLSFSRDGTARLWDVVSGELGACMADVSSSASEPTISPSGETVLFLRDRVTPVIAGLDGVVRAELPAQPDAVETACFSPDGRRLLVLCKDGSCGLWDLEGKPLASLREGGETVRAAAFHPGEGTVVTGTEAGAVRIWNSQGTLQRTLSAHGEPILRVEFSRGSRDLLTISRGGFRVWGPAELAGGARAGAAFEGEFSSPRARHLFSPGGDRLLTSTRLGEKEDQVCLWMRGRPAQGLMRARRTWPFHWAFSPDGSMAAVFEGATVMVHDRNWRLRASFESASTDGGLLQDLSFMPSGAALLTGGWGGRACLWDLDGNLLAEFRGHSERVGRVGSFASGERVVTCSDDRTVRIWDTSGKEIDVLEGHGAGVREFLLSPDMSRLLAVDRSGEIRVWTLRADELLSIAGRRTCRDFEGEELTRYADILGPQFASRRERFVRERRARNLVDFVSRMTPLAADAVEILRERQGVEPEVREIALKIAATLKDDARRLNSEAWGRTWHGDSGPEDVRKALRWAEAAVRLAPEDGQVLNTLGVARYRAGEYPAALETLRRSDGLNGGKEEADAAFLAMALHRLGKPEEARAEMARLRALLKDEQKAAMYAGSRSFIDEAVEVVEGGK